MEQPSGSTKLPPPSGNSFISQLLDISTTLPVLAVTIAVGGVLCLVFLLRRHLRWRMQTFSLPPSAAAAANSSADDAAAAGSPLPSSSSTCSSSSSSSPIFLDKSRKKLLLLEKHAISPDTHRFRFALEHPQQTLGLPIGKHIKIFAPAAASLSSSTTSGSSSSSREGRSGVEDTKDREEIERKYTPITTDEVKGYVDLVVKVYHRGQDPRFPDGGKMSQYLHTLQPGQYIDVQGPIGRIEYLGDGSFSISRKLLLPNKKRIGMLTGGTGITPIYQLIKAITMNPSDNTSLSLLHANKTEADILLKTELDRLSEEHSEQLQVYYTVAAPAAASSSSFYSGFIDKYMIQDTMPAPAADTLILVCGSSIMVANCKRDLLELGYAKEDILEF